MKTTDLLNLPQEFCEARAVTLGIFDGVHLGHQKIMEKLRQVDPQNSLVITFSEHPDKVLWNREIQWIYPHSQRLELIRQFGPQNVVELPFTQELSMISAQDFARVLFLEVLKSPHVVLGYDLRFGHKAQGNCDFLQENFGDALEITRLDPIEYQQKPISSTRIREAILMGELERVSSMLGRPFSTFGQVIKGYQRGRQLGFPTANLDLSSKTILPPFGVYAVTVTSTKLKSSYRAVANLGLRPTFENQSEPQLEVHIPNFSGDLYGASLEVVWDRFIRPEKRFPNRDELIAQIKLDIQQATDGP